MPFKRWNLPTDTSNISNAIASDCSINNIVARVLYNRGYSTTADILSFVEQITEIESPYVMADMQKAVDRIRQAIDDYEMIGIFGDYDCDGVTSTTLLYTYLDSVGANVVYDLPTREDGYGLNMSVMDKFNDLGVTLIITVDNGVSAFEEIDYANSLGINVIITDHHQPSEILPNAYAIVNPHRKDCKSSFKPLAGVGVAFKLVTALEDSDYDSTLEYFSDILAIGTVGDIVSLTGENRLYVQRGLKMLSVTDNVGIRALMQASNLQDKSITSQNIAFGIVPRINAAGRIATAKQAVDLLLCDDYDQAVEMAKSITSLNSKRQEIEKEIILEIFEQIKNTPSILTERVLLFKSDKFDHGIIGITASKLVDKFGKPVLIMCEQDGQITGSARSIGEFNLFNVLTDCKRLLTKFGGHKLAAGFSLLSENYTNFYKAVQAHAAKYYDIMPQGEYKPDTFLAYDEISIDTANELKLLEPFGEKNDLPLFLVKNAKIKSVYPLSENKHVKIRVEVGAKAVDALYFGISTTTLGYNIGDEVDLLVTLDINEYNNNKSLSVKVKDIRPSKFNQDAFFNAKGYYEKIVRNEPLKSQILSRATPTRDEIAVVYKYIRGIKTYNNDIDKLYLVFEKQGINYCKFRFIIDILSDVELIKLSPLLDSIEIIQTTNKVDINSAKTLINLHNYSKAIG